VIALEGQAMLPWKPQPVGSRGEIVNHSSLARLVATVVILIGLAIWLKAERNKLFGCHVNCPTDFSASSKGER
jgi:hypothetical protein